MTNVVVIGAGFAGLAAADTLRTAGLDVQVLEARDRVGGRVLSRDIGGYRFDLGGQWLDRKHTAMLGLVRRFGLRTWPQYRRGANLLTLDGRTERYRRILPPIGLRDTALLVRELVRQEWACFRHGTADPANDPAAAERDAVTVADVLERAVPSRRARAICTIAAEMVMADDTDAYSLQYYLRYMRAGGGVRRLIDVEHGAQDLRVRGGTQPIAEALARAIGSDRIRFDQPVRAISQDGDAVEVVTDSGTLRAAHAIVAVPPPVLADIACDWPAPIASLAHHTRMGSVAKLIATFERPFWRDRDLSGETIRADGPIRATFDNTPPGGPASLVAFAVGSGARALQGKTEQERQEVFRSYLDAVFGDVPAFTGYADLVWQTEPYSRGGYAGLLGPGGLRAAGSALGGRHGRVHLAGTEHADAFVGYMEGAVRSGRKAAATVLQGR